MKLLKTILLSSLSLGTVTVTTLMLTPTEVQAGIFGKIARLLRAAAEFFEALDDLLSRMAPGDTTNQNTPFDLNQVRVSGHEFGIFYNPDNQTIRLDRDVDAVTSDDGSKKLVMKKGIYDCDINGNVLMTYEAQVAH